MHDRLELRKQTEEMIREEKSKIEDLRTKFADDAEKESELMKEAWKVQEL